MRFFYQFLSGAIMMGCWVMGVFFHKFWLKTRDKLFLSFSLAFWIMALERIVLISLTDRDNENNAVVYLIRLAAFVLILIGIINKNTSEAKKVN